MPSGSALAALGQEALLLAVAVSLPVVAIAALVGLLVAVLQAATQVQDATLAHLPRLLVVAVVLGWTIGGEPMSTRVLLGAGIIVGSVVLVLTKKTTAAMGDTAPTEA